MKSVNKYKDIIIDYYNGNEEDNRFTKSKGTNVEFFTTMHYIHKYIKKGMKILEIGAGTGVYSISLAKEGYAVTAIELVQSNLDILIEKAKGIQNLIAMQGDALDLSRFKDNSFDMVLVLGPLYHLFNQRDKDLAIKEAIRVCKQKGVLMFAYISHSAVVWSYGVKKQKFDYLSPFVKKDGSIKDAPKEIFSTYYIDEFKKQFEKTNTNFLKNISADGLAYGIGRDYVDALDNKKYNLFLDWHLKTCEREDQQGLSSHLLYICRKK